MSLAQAAQLEATACTLELEARQLRALAQEIRNSNAACEDGETAKSVGNEDGTKTGSPTLADSALSSQSLSKNTHELRNSSASAPTIERLPEHEKHLEVPRKVESEKPTELGKRSDLATSAEKPPERPPKRRVNVSRTSTADADKDAAPPRRAPTNARLSAASEKSENSEANSSGKSLDDIAAASSVAHRHWACEACTLENEGCVG
jgi:hypothetical protein